MPTSCDLKAKRLVQAEAQNALSRSGGSKAGRCNRSPPVQSSAYVRCGASCPDGRNSAAARTRCARTLTLTERRRSPATTVEGQSIRSIAAQLGRAPSTAAAAKRNGRQAVYRASEADLAAWAEPCVSQVLQNSREQSLGELVTEKLVALVPEQIADAQGVHPHDESGRACHTRRSTAVSHPGAWSPKTELLQHLRPPVHASSRNHTQRPISTVRCRA